MKELGEREKVRDDGLSGEDPGMIMRTISPFSYWVEDYAVGKLKKIK